MEAKKFLEAILEDKFVSVRKLAQLLGTQEAQDSKEDIVCAIKTENTALKEEIKKLNSRLVDKDDVIQNLVEILKNKMQ